MRLLIIIISLIASINSVLAQNNINFIRGAYNAGSSMKSINYVEDIDLAKFNFYYLIGFPEWDNADFDKPYEYVLNKYVTDFSYSSTPIGRGLISDFIAKAHDVNSKVLLSINKSQIKDIANSESRSICFAKMISAFIDKFGYDGFDLDWENSLDLDNHYKFLSILRKELSGKEKYYYITTALPTSVKYTATLAKDISKIVDWINVMTYDLGGGTWDPKASFNTSLSIIKSRLKSNWSVFVPSKLCIGLASYGYYYKNLKPNQRIPLNSSMSEYASSISYLTCIDSIKRSGWSERWNDEASAPYYFSSGMNSFITCDNPKSIQLKINWVKQNGYRGVFWWELYQDFVIKDSRDKFGRFLLKDSVHY